MGRDDSAADVQLTCRPVAVISEFTATSMFPAESPIGKRVKFDLADAEIWFTIIGIVPDVVMDDDGTIDEGAYLSVLQRPERFMSIVVRGEGDPRSLAAPIRTALSQTDPDLALYWVRTFDESLRIRTAGFRLIGTMFGALAGVALVLAADGSILRLVMRASGLQVARTRRYPGEPEPVDPVIYFLVLALMFTVAIAASAEDRSRGGIALRVRP